MMLRLHKVAQCHLRYGIALFVVIGLLVSGVSGSRLMAESRDRPNVVLIMIDDFFALNPGAMQARSYPAHD